MTAIEDFIATTGYLPRDSRARRIDPGTSEERRLARFLRYQRYNELNLTAAQQERLDRLPGFDWTPVESAWWLRHADYRRFVASHGRIPRRRSRDPLERELELWYQRQNVRERRGLLPHHLRAPFAELGASVHGVDKNP